MSDVLAFAIVAVMLVAACACIIVGVRSDERKDYRR